MTSKTAAVRVAAIVISIAAVGAALGYAITLTSSRAVVSQTDWSTGYGKTDAQSASGSTPEDVSVPDERGPVVAGGEGDAVASVRTPSDSLVIRTSAIEVRVARIDAAIAGLRAAVARAGGEISDMNVSRGVGAGGTRGVVADLPQGPAFASVTIRVPAQDLSRLEDEVAGLGSVVTQSSSADDVTEAAIDLGARLKNLRAEETRLRSFLERTDKVSELLEVERELARVRGEIESMEAQLTYLERQSARATLTVALAEPAPLAESGGISWGIREALARGLAVTASILTGLVTIGVPLALLTFVALLVYVPARIIRRRRSNTQAVADAPSINGDPEG